MFRRIIAAIRTACPDLLISATTSGRVHKLFSQRAQVLSLTGRLKPDLGSLTLGSMNFPTQASVNEPRMIQALATTMLQRGILPKLELFDLEMVDYARYLIDHGILRPPHHANILLGSLGTLAATPQNLTVMVAALPPRTTWSATGIGRFQLFVNSMAITMGGHVRVGLEDNFWLDAARTQLATNARLVERSVTHARAVGARRCHTGRGPADHRPAGGGFPAAACGAAANYAGPQK